nr:hypothetical protein [uncultured Cohaesibacter sp.]
MDKKRFLDAVTRLFPVTGLIHIGPSKISDIDLYKSWSISQVLFFDAEQNGFSRLEKTIENEDGWTANPTLLAAESKPYDFFCVSNRAESGLINPSKLSQVWPNLTLIEKQTIKALSLDDCLPTIWGEDQRNRTNWLVVSRLDSLTALRGASHILSRLSVVVSRIMVDHPAAPDLGRSALDAFLTKRGFDAVAQFDETHPHLAYMIYVKNWCRAHRNLHENYISHKSNAENTIRNLENDKQSFAQKSEELTAKLTSLEVDNKRLLEQKGEADKAKEEFDVKLQAKESELDQSKAEVARLSAQVSEMAGLREEIEGLKVVLGAKTKDLEQAHAQITRLGELEKEIEGLKEDLSAKTKDLEQAHAQITRLGESEKEIESLKEDLSAKTKDLEQARAQITRLGELEKEIEGLKEDLGAKTKDLEQAHAQITRLGELEKDANNLREEVKDLNAKLLLKNTDNKALRVKYANLHQLISQQQLAVGKIKSMLLATDLIEATQSDEGSDDE